MQPKIGIICGGKSAEHEVSLQSAKNIFEAIDKDKYEPILIGITKTGRWLLGDKPSDFILHSEDPRRICLNSDSDLVVLLPGEGGKVFNLSRPERELKLDVVFPVTHGPLGEDGSLQGLLKLAGVPFVGPDVLGSAAGMDKVVTKCLLRDAGLPIGKFIALQTHEPAPSFQRVQEKIGLPFFLKPANMGSSIGVYKIRDKKEYIEGLTKAFRFDTKVILEEYIPGREIECAILGNENPQASPLGEIIPTHEFYSYDAKYIDEQGGIIEIPAKLPEATAKEIQRLAVETFRTLCCEGMSRVDFFLKENGEIFINEINTLPGFTQISMYPKLWEAGGIAYPALINRLIQYALQRQAQKEKLLTSSGES